MASLRYLLPTIKDSFTNTSVLNRGLNSRHNAGGYTTHILLMSHGDNAPAEVSPSGQSSRPHVQYVSLGEDAYCVESAQASLLFDHTRTMPTAAIASEASQQRKGPRVLATFLGLPTHCSQHHPEPRQVAPGGLTDDTWKLPNNGSSIAAETSRAAPESRLLLLATEVSCRRYGMLAI